MENRRSILEYFEEQKSFLDSTVRENIERYRKGDCILSLVDSMGNPITDATVFVKQKSHAFRFGANLFMLDELETKEKNDAYKQAFADVFNMATLPFYWDTLEPERGKPRYSADSPKVYRRPAIDLCLAFCEQHGIEPREHALAYDHFFPEWLYDASVEEVKRELERRYAEISERYADKIHTIEVTNEMEHDNGKTSFYEEPDYVEWCFKLAEKYFPNNQLGINEHTSSAWEDKCRATDKYYAYIEANMLKGARIDAIGMQYHLFKKREDLYKKTRKTLNPGLLYRHMDLYSNFGKPLQITEVTIPAYSWEREDEELQAEILEKLYSVWFSHPNVEQIIYWNLVDGYAYVPYTDVNEIAATQGNMSLGENYYHGGLLRFDMSPKPAYYAIKKLLQNVWHTEQQLTADSSGLFRFRGFFGTYDATVTVNGKTYTKELSLNKGDMLPIQITL